MAPTVVETTKKPSNIPSNEKETAEFLLNRSKRSTRGAGRRSGVLLAADVFISSFVVAPLVIGFWRGTWELVGQWPRYFPNEALLIGGAITHFLFAVVRDVICKDWDYRNFTNPKRFFFKVVSRLYLYVFGVACVFHWRGVFFLLDVHAGVQSTIVIALWIGSIATLAGLRCLRNLNAPPLVIGLDGPDFCFTFSIMFRSNVQRRLNRVLHPDRHRLIYYVSSRMYTALFGLCCVNSWRGVWMVLDHYTGGSPGTVITITTASILALAAMKVLRNVSAPPFVLVTDNHENYFDVPTMFHTSSKQTALYILDCLFSVCVVHTLVVFAWRGAWCIVDIYLYPDDKRLSALGSLAIGYSIEFISFGLQPCMMKLVLYVDGWWRILLVDVYHLFSFFGTVNVWRGVWNGLTQFLLPDNHLASNWISHILSFGLLVLLNCANSILVRGVYIDAEEEGSQCVEFPVYYLRLLFQNRRRKKLMRMRGNAGISCLHSARRRSELDKGSFLHDTNYLNKCSSSASPPDSRKGSGTHQSCLNHHNHHHGHIRMHLPNEKENFTFIDIPESPV